MNDLVLALFSGIGLLDQAFEDQGFCVVRGPDVLWGGDVKRFHPPGGVFSGVIGGPPCQAFSPLRHMVEHVYGKGRVAENLIPEYERVVAEAGPQWFLMENSRYAPPAHVPGYQVHSFILNNRWLGEKQKRERRFSFGFRGSLRKLQVEVVALEHFEHEYAVVGDTRSVTVKMVRGKVKPQWANNKPRTIGDMLELQGFRRDLLEKAPFTAEAKRQVIANGVPYAMGCAVARAVIRAIASNG
jgi:DNA (cytosine-5)-methyltransferase 1